MKVNLAVILESIDSLRVVADQRFPGKPQVTWNLAKLLKKCESIVKQFNDVRDKIVRQYGQATPDGKGIMVMPENQQKFVDEVALLLRQEVETNLKGYFKIEDINNGNIEPKHLASISWIFGEEGDEDSGIDTTFIQDRAASTVTPSAAGTPIEVVGDSTEGVAGETEVVNVST